MIIELNSFPPSSNSMYLSSGRYRNLSPKARAWIASANEQLKDLAQPEEFVGRPLAVLCTFQGPLWRCKNGHIRKADVSSREKCLIDTIFKLWPDMDDSQIYDLRLVKVEAEVEKVIVEMKLLTEEEMLEIKKKLFQVYN